MGIETALIVGTVAQAGLSVIGGIQANREAKRQAAIAQEEATERAKARKKEIEAFRSKQKMAFLKSGVLLEGSPLLVLQNTIDEGNAELKSIQRSGDSKSASLRAEGRSRLLSGFGDAIGSGIAGYSAYNQLQDPATATPQGE